MLQFYQFGPCALSFTIWALVIGPDSIICNTLVPKFTQQQECVAPNAEMCEQVQDDSGSVELNVTGNTVLNITIFGCYIL